MLFYERMHFFEKQVEARLALQSHVAVPRKLNKLRARDCASQQLPFLDRHDLIPLDVKNQSGNIDLLRDIQSARVIVHFLDAHCVFGRATHTLKRVETIANFS
ncbi:hypothetical protein LP7551_03739 [Roseibium album]|nr:hypothetical protein LP7551_03739 [Roseibium album]